MGKHKRQKKKKKISKEEFDRRLKIWSLVIPIVTSVFTSITAISVAYISSHKSPESEIQTVQKSFKMYSPEANQRKPTSPGEEVAPSMQEHFSYWPIILLIFLFLCVFFTVKFIGLSFVRHHYEPAEVSKEKETENT